MSKRSTQYGTYEKVNENITLVTNWESKEQVIGYKKYIYEYPCLKL